MGSGLKMAGAAATAALLTAGGFLAAQPPAELPGPGLLDQAPSTVSGRSVPDLEVGAAPKRLLAFDPSDDELAWLKTRLVEERARRTRAAVREADSGVDILRRVIEDGLDPRPLLADFKRFSGHVRTGEGMEQSFSASGAPQTTVNVASALQAGARVIEFGPGTFVVKGLRRFRMKDPVPSLEFRGAGMDETTLLIASHSTLRVTQELTNLRFRDMTIDYGTQSELLDVREATGVILERVRLRNWARVGSSAAIGIAGRAYVGCKDCEFEHTDGRGGMFVINLRGPGLAVFEACTFRNVESAIVGDRSSKSSQVLLKDCTFDETALADSRIEVFKGRPALEIRVRGGTISFRGAGMKPEKRRARWGAQWATELTNVVIEANRNSLTPGGLAAILRSVELPRGEILHTVIVARFRDGAPTALRLSTQVLKAQRGKVYTLSRGADGWHLQHRPRGGGHAYGLAHDKPPRDLLALLESAQVPTDLQVRSASCQLHAVKKAGSDEKEWVPTLVLRPDWSQSILPVIIHAETEAWLNNPGR